MNWKERTGSSLLFRGVTDAGRMIFGTPRIIDDNTYITPMGERYCIRVRAETVGQYIGSKDDNGVAIFEDDVVVATYDELDIGTGELQKRKKGTFVVCYDRENERWIYRNGETILSKVIIERHYLIYLLTGARVIGNVWDGKGYDCGEEKTE